MSYHFPPPNPPEISTAAFVANVVLMTIALAAALGAFRKTIRGQRRTLFRPWGAAIAIVAIVCTLGLSSAQLRTDMPIYFGLVWLTVVPVAVLSLALQLLGRRPTVGFIAGCLVGTGLMVFMIVAPTISTAKNAGRRQQCRNNLTSVERAFSGQREGSELPTTTADGDPPVSWRTRVYRMPGFEPESLLPQPPFDLAKPWNDPANVALGRVRVESLVCPANFNPVDKLGRHYTAVLAITGPASACPDGQALSIAKFTDGTSQTIVYGEAPGLRIVWTEPRDIDISREPLGINLPGSRRGESPGTLSSYHPPGGAHAVFADGTVRLLSDRIDPAVLKALLTATGGEMIGNDSW